MPFVLDMDGLAVRDDIRRDRSAALRKNDTPRLSERWTLVSKKGAQDLRNVPDDETSSVRKYSQKDNSSVTVVLSAQFSFRLSSLCVCIRV